ncbi:MAG: nucleoside recognition domain-containing protein [Nitrospinales bacterium]
MLNLIWITFFAVSFLSAILQFVFFNDADVFSRLMKAAFDMAQTGFEISLGLVGVMTFWLGIMKIGEQGGFLNLLTRAMTPFLRKVFPDIPDNHPAFGAMLMNFAANMLGLDNAATPLGLKAMKELQTINPQNDTASNSQILFLVINTSSVTLFPVAIFTYRAQQGAMNPTDVFIPILIATFFSSLVGLVAVSFYQKINLLDRTVVLYLGGISILLGGVMFYFSQLDQMNMQRQSSIISNFILFLIIILFIAGAALKKINVYDAFIDGAKDGFKTAVTIIPYLIAMLVAIGVFRASGAMDIILNIIRQGVSAIGLDVRFVEGLPTALMKPLSGSGSRGMMVEAMQTYGADSFTGRLTSVIQGSTETTFYVIALYFGAVKISHIRHAAKCGLIADVGGIIAAIILCYFFFG